MSSLYKNLKHNDPETYQSFRDRFPQLYEAIMASETRKQLSRVVKDILAKYDDDTLEYPCCDGAVETFKQEWIESNAVVSTPTAEQSRVNRILFITNSDGKRTARKSH